jgi:hypothetical protein
VGASNLGGCTVFLLGEGKTAYPESIAETPEKVEKMECDDNAIFVVDLFSNLFCCFEQSDGSLPLTLQIKGRIKVILQKSVRQEFR